jgi:hypothetical protein
MPQKLSHLYFQSPMVSWRISGKRSFQGKGETDRLTSVQDERQQDVYLTLKSPYLEYLEVNSTTNGPIDDRRETLTTIVQTVPKETASMPILETELRN